MCTNYCAIYCVICHLDILRNICYYIDTKRAEPNFNKACCNRLAKHKGASTARRDGNQNTGGKHHEKAAKTRACDNRKPKHFGIVRNRAKAFLYDLARTNFEALQREKAKGKLVYTKACISTADCQSKDKKSKRKIR